MASEEMDLMRRQVEAHERAATAQERIADSLEKVTKALVQDYSDGTVCVRVAQI